MSRKFFVFTIILATLLSLGIAGPLYIVPVHAAPTFPVLLDANSTGATDANPQSTSTVAKSFNVGIIIEANSSTPLNNVFGWQVAIVYENSSVVPQGDPLPSSATDGASSTVNFGAMTTAGQVNWAGKISTGAGFGSSTLVGVDSTHVEIQVFFTLVSGAALTINPAASGTVKGNLLANVVFELLGPVSTFTFSIDQANTKFVDSTASILPGIVAGPAVTVTNTNHPPVASFTVTHLPEADPSCVPITTLPCTAFAVRLDASASSDSDGTIANPTGYFWDFGDGTQDNAFSPTNQGPIAIHDYGTAVKLDITLRVVDDLGATGSARDALGGVILNIQPSHKVRSVNLLDPTTTSVSCLPSSVVLDASSTCTATVTDVLSSGATTPTGTVEWSSSGSGNFVTSPCTLTATTPPAAACSVDYTPTAIGSGTHTLTANYTGDTTHDFSRGNAGLTVTPHPTTTSVSCDTPVVVAQDSSCTVTVTDTGPGPSAPTGTVTFSHSGSAGVFSTNHCTLASPSGGSASCAAPFSPSASGTAIIGAAYGGDSSHSSSFTSGSANFSMTVNLRTTTTVVTCSPDPVTVYSASQCTAFAKDSSSVGNPTPPAGTVSFTQTGTTGSFDHVSCVLSPAGNFTTSSCSVLFTPITTGTASVSASYSPSDQSHSASSALSPATFTATFGPSGSTFTSVSCSPAVIVNQASACTAFVLDISGTPTTPAGVVTFGATGSANGLFGSTSPCTLVAGAVVGNASCTASFVPSSPGTASINVAYTPSDTHSPGSSTTSPTITVTSRTSSTTVSCATPVTTNTPSACTVTVADTSAAGSAVAPGGTVSLTAGGGSFSGTCTLSGSGASATCAVSFTSATAGSFTINATYVGDGAHGRSTGVFGLVVNTPLVPPTLSVTGPSSATTGTQVTLTLLSSASNGASVTSITVNWGDGTVEPLSGTSTIATHTYSAAGTYNVTLTAKDSNGLTTVKSQTISVTEAAPPLIPGGTTTIIAIIIAVVAAIGTVLFLRKRGKRSAPATNPAPTSPKPR